jgi:ABC-type sugar transport system ATPase subunit
VLLRVDRLSSVGTFSDVSFTVRAGEIVGLAGLVGAGRSSIAKVLFGIDRPREGTVAVKGRDVVIRSPRDAIREGIGLVPEDRKQQSIIPIESTVHNISLPILERMARFSWIRRGAERSMARELAERLRISASKLDAPIASLSGGNQQKVILARWLAARSTILILDEPTRGVDVGAKAEIHGLIIELASRGHGILLISSELPELLEVSSRILVLRAGKLVGEVDGEQATEAGLLRLMAGLEEGDQPIVV